MVWVWCGGLLGLACWGLWIGMCVGAWPVRGVRPCVFLRKCQQEHESTTQPTPTISRIQLSLLVMDPSMSEQSRGGAEQTILTTSQAGRRRWRALYMEFWWCEGGFGGCGVDTRVHEECVKKVSWRTHSSLGAMETSMPW